MHTTIPYISDTPEKGLNINYNKETHYSLLVVIEHALTIIGANHQLLLSINTVSCFICCHVLYAVMFAVSSWVRRRETLDQQEAELLSRVRNLRQRVLQQSLQQSRDSSANYTTSLSTEPFSSVVTPTTDHNTWMCNCVISTYVCTYVYFSNYIKCCS